MSTLFDQSKKVLYHHSNKLKQNHKLRNLKNSIDLVIDNKGKINHDFSKSLVSKNTDQIQALSYLDAQKFVNKRKNMQNESNKEKPYSNRRPRYRSNLAPIKTKVMMP